MSNANRDYAIVYDIKNGSLVLSRPLNFYITDKNTSNIFVKLVTRIIVGDGIDQYVDIEQASDYVLTMRVVKPNNEIKSINATQHEPESIFQFNLTEDFKDIPGKYICELTVSTMVNSRRELITSDPFGYEVKRSVLSNVGEIIETENTTVEKLLNDLESVKSELSSKVNKNEGGVITNAMLSQEVKEAMTGGSVAVIGKDSILAENIVDGQVEPLKTSFLKQNKNLFCIERAIEGYRLDSSGNPFADELYLLSEYIPIENTKYIFHLIDNAKTERICLYNSSKQFTSILFGGLPAGVRKVNLTEGYIRIAIKKADSQKICFIKNSDYANKFVTPGYSLGSNIEFPENCIGLEQMKNKVVTADMTNFIIEHRSPNLFNKSKSTLGEVLNSSSTLEGYSTSDYIPVVFGKSYVISPRTRIYNLYNENKQKIETVSSTSLTPVITPIANGYIRFTYFNEDEDILQMEEGTQPTEYSPFGLSYYEVKNSMNDKNIELKMEEMKEEIKNVTFNKEPVIKLIKKGNQYDIISTINDNTLKVQTNKYGSKNNSFNFIGTILNNNPIHSCTDDITPIRTFTTVGANHGYTCAFTVTNSGKQKADIGSIWSDGTNNYCLVNVTDTLLTFINDYYIDNNGVVIGNSQLPTNNLTHVSGATNTGSIDVSSKASIQLYPSTNNVSVKYFLDNKEIVEDGEYIGCELNVVESYNIMSYKELYNFIKNNKGIWYKESEQFNNIKGVVKLTINYNFQSAFNCLISHSFEALEKVSIQDCGFVQSSRMGQDNAILKRYMPHVNVKNGYDFSNQVDMTSYNTNLKFTSNDLLDSNIPPNRVVDWLYVNNEKTIGFALGYIPDISHSKNDNRKLLTTMWDLRNSKKIYPVALTGDIFDIGDYRTILAYRCYLPKQEATFENILTVGDSKYIFIDYHKNIRKKLKIDSEIGKKIEVILSNNFVLQNDIIDVNGISFKIINGNGYAILKIS